MSEKISLSGCFHRAANGRLCYEIYRATPDFIRVVAQVLCDRHGFPKAKRLLYGVEEVLTECCRDGVRVLLGWDHWSGFYLLADSIAGDVAVQDVGQYLDSIMHREEYDSYIHRW